MTLRRVPFRVALRVAVGDVVERRGWLVEGPEGWGEYSPLPSWSHNECLAAERSAEQAATVAFPAPRHDRVEVNMMVPRVAPDVAAQLAAEAGCRTVKVKVGDPASADRVRAVREAIGPHGRLRLDANGSWDLETAERELGRLAPFDIELVEDPVQQMDDLARLRRKVSVPVGAESCVRTPDDARRLRQLDAADAVVIKPQRIGGIRAALQAAEDAGVPAIMSSALETSVGLAMVLAAAAALPEIPYACGIGTALLLTSDVTTDPLIPVDGTLTPRRVAADPSLFEAAT